MIEFGLLLMIVVFIIFMGCFAIWALSMLYMALFGDLIIRRQAVEKQRKQWEKRENEKRK